MDAKELGNQPAYPLNGPRNDEDQLGRIYGLTKREAFALAAPQKDIEDVMPDSRGGCALLLGMSNEEYSKDTTGNYFLAVARMRFKWADAMLAELAKGGA